MSGVAASKPLVSRLQPEAGPTSLYGFAFLFWNAPPRGERGAGGRDTRSSPVLTPAEGIRLSQGLHSPSTEHPGTELARCCGVTTRGQWRLCDDLLRVALEARRWEGAHLPMFSEPLPQESHRLWGT